MIIKRRGHREGYDERKIYASVYAACLAAQKSEEEAERVAQALAAHLTRWVRNKEGLSSNDLFRQVIIELGRHAPKAAFLYENHRDLS